MEYEKWDTLHDRSCPHCDSTPFRIERGYVKLTSTDGEIVAEGDAHCRDCYELFDDNELPVEVLDGWVMVTR